ncbi:hypothetical protein PRK78_000535 [Emydomyces testavorans]|uniref:Impact protein n=1 Tax=Emydomyces testavorans TaxID=2070801 RepID=A0AAF0IFQ6_9EURO|nr:hypothetical protein PRK78_000535 [Emydomyces testavorans]
MATAAEVQVILRFLSQDAKVPLSLAIAKVKDLQEAKLLNIEALAKTDIRSLQAIFNEEKLTKQVSNAAKRAAKKRSADGDLPPFTSKKSKRTLEVGVAATPAQVELSLALPVCTDVDEISEATVVTNRAPLVLAFAFILLKYTMPEQPISSRFSLAQAIVSANSRSKAASLGIEQGPSPEEEGWAKGQPTVTILGRDISVLRRLNYSWNEAGQNDDSQESSATLKDETNVSENLSPLWGLDLEALRKSDKPAIPEADQGRRSVLPIYRPEAARDYLLKSFSLNEQDPAAGPGKKTKRLANLVSNQEKCLGLVLGAIDLLCQSWSFTLSKHDLDKRAWAWYLKVRPDVQTGPAGWGQKGRVHLSDILDLRK